MCWLMLLPLVIAAAIRARRENVISFLNDALDTTTGKTLPSILTAHKNLLNDPKTEQYSQDLSEDQSTESVKHDSIAEPAESDANVGGESEDLNSDEIHQSREKLPPRRQIGAVNVSRRRAQDQQSGEHADVNSEEEIIDGVNMSSLLPIQDSSVDRKSSAEGAHSLAPSREMVDEDSLPMNSAALVRDFDDDGDGYKDDGHQQICTHNTCQIDRLNLVA
ncbi:uncharacterized protein LOC130914708 [Corythoichthys intestinalis]|uniref:uncharacterized protein LOC130914708 n=1 Tax=Corythoichthys intestinalis TaxID=161448 RepID=UPI0025A6802F|nr:uncharacterized protein LOC130914708 [Corythoichthys intestinalis]